MEARTKEVALNRAITRWPGFSGVGRYVGPILLFLGDYALLVAALLSAWYIREGLARLIPAIKMAGVMPRMIYIDIPIVYMGFALYEGLFIKRIPFWQGAQKIAKVCFFTILMVISGLFFTKTLDDVPRIFMLISLLLSSIYLIIGRFFMKRLMVQAGIWQKPVLIIGAGRTAELLATSFEDDPNMGYKIVGVVDDFTQERPLTSHYPYLGSFNTIERSIAIAAVNDVIIATPGIQREELVKLVNRVQPLVKNVIVVPDLFGLPLTNIEAEPMFNQKALLLRVRNNLSSCTNQVMKKLFDLLIGTITMIVSIPIMMGIAILIKLDSSGPVMHVAKRIGKDGCEFDCYKFRTMQLNSDALLTSYFEENAAAKEEWQQFEKLRSHDPRVTRIGRWLRKTSLDELPQLFNVLNGTMSLVGPRPYLPREEERIGFAINTILLTRPGITGLWQVSGRNQIDFEGRILLDLWYVRNWSLWLDIILLIKTVGVVLHRKGAY